MTDVALATCAALPEMIPDERMLLPALAAAGLRAEMHAWTDPAADWARARCCVIRATWDYTGDRDAFVAWARRTEAVTTLCNPADVVAWNTHKGYLRDLAARGVPAVPTVHLRAGERADAFALAARAGWTELVLKPAVGATAREALRTRDPVRAQRHLDRLLPREDMMLQPFVESVRDRGETSLVYFDGRYSHAVRKRPARGDWRVQDEFGGSIGPATPTDAERETAARAIAAVGADLLYARVDLVHAAGGPRLIELELVEPALYLGAHPAAPAAFAAAIARRI